MSGPDYRAGAMLGVVIHLLAELSVIAIAVVLILAAANVVTLR